MFVFVFCFTLKRMSFFLEVLYTTVGANVNNSVVYLKKKKVTVDERKERNDEKKEKEESVHNVGN